MTAFNTKIALLYKTKAEWDANSTYVPLKGEVCFCEFPADLSGKKDVLFKVGNGEDTFAQLSWGMAITPVLE